MEVVSASDSLVRSLDDSTNLLSHLTDLDIEELRKQIRIAVRRRLKGRLRRKLDESDIVQQTLVDVLLSSKMLGGDELKAWIKVIAKNNLLDVIRYFKHAECRSIVAEVDVDSAVLRESVSSRDMTASKLFQRKEEQLRLTLALRFLPADDREIIELRHRQGMKFTSIGERLGISEQAARKRWKRIIENLKAALANS